MRRALAAVAISALTLTGCGGPEGEATETPSTAAHSAHSSDSVGSKSTPSPSKEATQDDKGDDGIEIEIEADQIEPNGERVKVEAGQAIRLEIQSDRTGELHVHSSPEQEIAFKQGESVVNLTVDTPGIVDVEEHEAGTVLLQLEVR